MSASLFDRLFFSSFSRSSWTGIGRAGTSRREVIAVEHVSHRYDYAGERAFQVRIGVDSAETVDVPWSMLERCYSELVAGGHDGKVFRRLYRKQADIHACHIHVIGMMFILAGLATSDGRAQARYTQVGPTRALNTGT